MTIARTGPWLLPMEGFEVLTIIFAFQVDVVAYGDEGASGTFRFGGAFSLSESSGQVHRFDAESQSWEELAIVLTLRHDKVTKVTVSEEAELHVDFASVRSLHAEPDSRPYEHWEASGPDFKLIGLPGDGAEGVAVFSEP